jgi:hypothetical protein
MLHPLNGARYPRRGAVIILHNHSDGYCDTVPSVAIGPKWYTQADIT